MRMRYGIYVLCRKVASRIGKCGVDEGVAHNLADVWEVGGDEKSRLEKMEADLQEIKKAILGKRVVDVEGVRKIEDYV